LQSLQDKGTTNFKKKDAQLMVHLKEEVDKDE